MAISSYRAAYTVKTGSYDFDPGTWPVIGACQPQGSPITRQSGMATNPCRAESILGIIKTHLYFLSYLNTAKSQEVKIIVRTRQGPIYPAYSVSWLVMTWQRKNQGTSTEQLWYRTSYTGVHHFVSPPKGLNTDNGNILNHGISARAFVIEIISDCIHSNLE